MKFRAANIGDISQIQVVRRSVRENRLNDPQSVTDRICKTYITTRGKGWVCEIDHQIVGFSIADLQEDNVWALFLRPEYEGKGIGRKLHDMMLDWYFSNGKERIWLGTSPNTRAERFYRKAGWIENGKHGNEEIMFVMTKDRWLGIRPYVLQPGSG